MHEQFPAWDLYIYGNDYGTKIKKRIRYHRLAKRVQVRSFVDNYDEVLLQSIDRDRKEGGKLWGGRHIIELYKAYNEVKANLNNVQANLWYSFGQESTKEKIKILIGSMLKKSI